MDGFEDTQGSQASQDFKDSKMSILMRTELLVGSFTYVQWLKKKHTLKRPTTYDVI
jgi:hypothetical protein